MKISRKTKTTILLYTNLVAAMVALGSFTYTSLAWFAFDRAKAINAASIEVDAPGFTVDDFECYAVTTISKNSTTTNITFANEPLFAMPTYDPQGIEYNRFMKAIVVRVTFTYTENAPVVFYAKNSNPTFSTGTTGIENNDENFTSNCFQLTISSGTTLPSMWDTASLSYTNANTKSFVTIASTPSKVTSLTLGAISAAINEIWFVIEYNPMVMAYIDNARLSNNRPVLYQDDISYQIAP